MADCRRSQMLPSWLSLALAAVGCAEGQTTAVQGMQAADGGSAVAEVETMGKVAGGSKHPAMAVVCANEQPLPVAMIPEAFPKGPGVTLYRQVDSACDRDDPSQVVLYNESQRPVRITALGFDDPRFWVEAPQGAVELQGGDILEVSIGFGAELGAFDAELIVAADEGCARFEVSGSAVEANAAGLALTRPYVVSFGHVAAGSTSEPLELAVITQPKTGDTPRKVRGFGSSSASFRVLPATDAALDSNACEGAKTRIQLVAPTEPGIVRGQLSWSLEAEDFSAHILTEMVGVVDGSS